MGGGTGGQTLRSTASFSNLADFFLEASILSNRPLGLLSANFLFSCTQQEGASHSAAAGARSQTTTKDP